MTKDLRMPETRVRDEKGNSTAVMLPGAKLRDGAIYYAPEHKGHLLCPHCDAKAHFNKGALSVCGDNLPGVQAHFKTNPGQVHAEDCILPLRLDEGRNPREYDLTRGYRIHLNLGWIANEFNSRARLFHRDADGRILFTDPDLAAREPYTVKSAADLVRLMKRGHYARLRDSVIVHRDQIIPWSDFFIRYNHAQAPAHSRTVAEPRFIRLVERLLDQDGRAILPVLMEVKLQKPVEVEEGQKSACGRSKAILWRYEGERTSRCAHFIQPRIYLDNVTDPAVAGALPKAGSYLVLGAVRLSTHKSWDRVMHFLNLSIRRADQITPTQIEDIIATPQLPLGLPKP